MVVLTVNYISCDNTIGTSTMKSNSDNTSCILSNVTDSSKIKSSCGNEIIYLFFRDSHFNQFPHVFEYYQNLRSVDLTNAGIQYIESTTFDGAVHLTSLEMDGSNITTLQNSVFSHANNLTTFEIQNSSISRIEDHAFQGLSRLKKLDLSYNNILHLKAAIFRPLSQLETLRMTNNKIQVIDRDLFLYNVNLGWVYLSSNNIITVDSDAFIHSKLVSLDLGFNQLKNFDLSTTKHLKMLIINDNKLDKLSVPPTVNLIHAENNSISMISSEETNNLTVLFLQSNCFYNLQNLAPFSKLTFLDLSKNHLQNIQLSDLKSLTQLKELKLTGNRLSEIKANDVITNLPQLEFIELSTKHWSTSYINELQDELHEHRIVMRQDRLDISDDDAKVVTTSPPSIVTTSHPTTKPMHPTEPTNTYNVEKRLEDINNRLIELESANSNGSANAKKIDEFEKEMEKKYNAILSTSTAHTILIIILFLIGSIVVFYITLVYLRPWIRAMRHRYQRARLDEQMGDEHL